MGGSLNPPWVKMWVKNTLGGLGLYLVFCVVAVEFAVNGNQALLQNLFLCFLA